MLKKMMIIRAIYCGHDAELIRLVGRSPEERYQTIDLFHNGGFFEPMELDSIS
jgi:hypothetical protein